jgi:hypothetical protein
LNVVSSENEAQRSIGLLNVLVEKCKCQKIDIKLFAEIGDIKDIGMIAEKLES